MPTAEQINKAIIEAVCTALPDRQVLQVAKFALMKRKGHAATHLDNYINGGGDIKVDLAQVFKEDKVLEKYVMGEIKFQMKRGETSGSVAVRQLHFGNQDWRWALGSINVNWKKTKKGIKVWFSNKYRWHPNENRISQCVHEAADNLKTKANAKEFDMYDKGTEIKLDFDANQPLM